MQDYTTILAGRLLLFGAGAFVIFSGLALAVAYADLKMTPVEPGSLRSDKALAYETEKRRAIHKSYKQIHVLLADKREEAIKDLQRSQIHAFDNYSARAPGFVRRSID